MKAIIVLAVISLVLLAGCQAETGTATAAIRGAPSPCDPPSGTSAESWKEHMSHHPEQYEECLAQ